MMAFSSKKPSRVAPAGHPFSPPFTEESWSSKASLEPSIRLDYEWRKFDRQINLDNVSASLRNHPTLAFVSDCKTKLHSTVPSLFPLYRAGARRQDSACAGLMPDLDRCAPARFRFLRAGAAEGPRRKEPSNEFSGTTHPRSHAAGPSAGNPSTLSMSANSGVGRSYVSRHGWIAAGRRKVPSGTRLQIEDSGRAPNSWRNAYRSGIHLAWPRQRQDHGKILRPMDWLSAKTSGRSCSNARFVEINAKKKSLNLVK